MDFKVTDEMIAKQDMFLRKYNNIYASKRQVEILEKYSIDINKYRNIEELIFSIEDYLNDSYEELDDLEWVSQSLSEFNYYNNSNK